MRQWRQLRSLADQLLAPNESFGQCLRRVDGCGTIVRDTRLAPSAGVPGHAHANHLLAMVASGAKHDRSLPHPFAEWWVMRRLGDRLGSGDRTTWKPDDVRRAAAAELAAQTALLQERGATCVESPLPD